MSLVQLSFFLSLCSYGSCCAEGRGRRESSGGVKLVITRLWRNHGAAPEFRLFNRVRGVGGQCDALTWADPHPRGSGRRAAATNRLGPTHLRTREIRRLRLALDEYWAPPPRHSNGYLISSAVCCAA